MLKGLALHFRKKNRLQCHSDTDSILNAAIETLKRKKYCLLTTYGENNIDARVLQPFPPENNFDIWFGTSPKTRKVSQLRKNSRATLIYQDDKKSANVVLIGHVEIIEQLSERKKYFMPTWWAFFPDGREGDDFVLLKFQPNQIEVWDASRKITPEPFGMKSATIILNDGKWEKL